jgi:hypothetical protein
MRQAAASPSRTERPAITWESDQNFAIDANLKRAAWDMHVIIAQDASHIERKFANFSSATVHRCSGTDYNRNRWADTCQRISNWLHYEYPCDAGQSRKRRFER